MAMLPVELHVAWGAAQAAAAESTSAVATTATPAFNACLPMRIIEPRLIEFPMDRVVIFLGFIFCFRWVVALLIVEDHLRRRFSYFELGGDFLDLRCLLF